MHIKIGRSSSSPHPSGAPGGLTAETGTSAATASLRPRLEHARYADLVELEATRLAADIAGADLATPVPSRPGWNLAQLTQHVGAELAWVEGMVRSRATEMVDDTALRRLDPTPARDADATARWIAAGGTALATALRGTTPATPVWSPFPGEGHAGFHARRFAHGDHPDAAWRIDLTGDAPSYRPASVRDAGAPVVVTARGPVLDVLLVLYRRRPADVLEVDGDRTLLDEWLGTSAFA